MVRNFNLEQLLPLNRVVYGYGHPTKTYRIDIPLSAMPALLDTCPMKCLPNEMRSLSHRGIEDMKRSGFNRGAMNRRFSAIPFPFSLCPLTFYLCPFTFYLHPLWAIQIRKCNADLHAPCRRRLVKLPILTPKWVV